MVNHDVKKTIELIKTSIVGNQTSKHQELTKESNIFTDEGFLEYSKIDSTVTMRDVAKGDANSSSDSEFSSLEQTVTKITQIITFVDDSVDSEIDSLVETIRNSGVVTTIQYDYQFLDTKIFPQIEILEMHRNSDQSGNSVGNQCSILSNECDNCTYSDPDPETDNSTVIESNATSPTRRNLGDPSKLILELVPFKLLSFSVLGKDVDAVIASKCYATNPGQDDVCEINLDAVVMGAKIPIIPTQTKKCKISKLAKKFQFFRYHIEREIDLIDTAIVQGIKNCTDSLRLIYDSVKNLTDPKSYDLFITAHELVTSFENVIDGIFQDTVGVLQQVQREVSSLISSPIEILKHSFESMASRNLDDSFTYMEDQVASLREVLEQIRTPVIGENGYLTFTYTADDLEGLTELKERAVNMKEAMLDDVRDVLTHFADQFSAPVNKLVDQILESILKFFGV